MKLITLDQIKPGMVCLSGGNTWIQKQIRFFTKREVKEWSVFSHSFVVMKGPQEITSSFETSSTIVHSMPMSSKLKEPDCLQVWELTQSSPEEADEANVKTYEEYSGVWYGYLSYLWFMWAWLCWKLFKKEPQTMWKAVANSVTCTELTCYNLVMRKNYARLFDGKDFSAQNPYKLRTMFEEHPELFREVGWLVLPKE